VSCMLMHSSLSCCCEVKELHCWRSLKCSVEVVLVVMTCLQNFVAVGMVAAHSLYSQLQEECNHVAKQHIGWKSMLSNWLLPLMAAGSPNMCGARQH